MKHLVTFAILILTCTAASAQVSIKIPGLVRSKVVQSISATSAALTTVTIPAPRGSGSMQATVWVITRNQDKISSAIQDAANRGRAFRGGIVRVGSTDHTLAQLFISNYSIAANANGSTETFYLQFSNQ